MGMGGEEPSRDLRMIESQHLPVGHSVKNKNEEYEHGHDSPTQGATWQNTSHSFSNSLTDQLPRADGHFIQEDIAFSSSIRLGPTTDKDAYRSVLSSTSVDLNKTIDDVLQDGGWLNRRENLARINTSNLDAPVVRPRSSSSFFSSSSSSSFSCSSFL